MNTDTLLSSIITASSIIIGVGTSIIIYLVSEFNNNKERYLSELKALYPKLNAYRELIYLISTFDIWKNKDAILNFKKAMQLADDNEIILLQKKHEFLHVYKSFEYISNLYNKDIIHNEKRIFSINEISNYQTQANYIWYTTYCRTEFIQEINTECFLYLKKHEIERINKAVSKIDHKFVTEKITYDLIADVSGEMEVTVLDNLLDLTKNFERPIESITKKLFGIVTLSLLFGVISPFFILILNSSYTLYLIALIILVLIFCLTGLIVFSGKFIGIC